MKCQYCASHLTHVVHHNERHKVDKSFGPFDLFECRSCGSLGTAEPPSPERLAQFYRGYDEFRPQWYNAAAAEGALAAQYNFYARFLARYVSARQSWVDIGAGHGEVANLLSQIRAHAPGQAIDIGDRPPALASEVGYDSIDLNAPDWVTAVGRQFDCVFSVAVWEHVLSPADFAREALSLVAPGGGSRSSVPTMARWRDVLLTAPGHISSPANTSQSRRALVPRPALRRLAPISASTTRGSAPRHST